MSSVSPDALRAVADWYDAHPELPQPIQITCDSVTDGQLVVRVADWLTDNKTMRETVRAYARALPHARKRYYSQFFALDADISSGPHEIHINVRVPRSAVCRRVVVGHKTVTEPATPEYERVEEIVEWRCDDPILAEGEA